MELEPARIYEKLYVKSLATEIQRRELSYLDWHF
jgi:hypothetical protein